MSEAAEAEQPFHRNDYCYLTTTGRRTGRPHRIEIWYAADGYTLYAPAGRGWQVVGLGAEPVR